MCFTELSYIAYLHQINIHVFGQSLAQKIQVIFLYAVQAYTTHRDPMLDEAFEYLLAMLISGKAQWCELHNVYL
jgi:hypothetical protein